jgi:hypothetical protein
VNTTELYAVIGVLIAAVLALAGLWVRAQDQHRLWATAKLTDHERVIAILEHDFAGVRQDVADIKDMITDHTKQDRRFQAAVARKLSLDVETD